jgi:putative two-component system response regulator
MSPVPRILIVDDEPSARQTLENLLYTEGYAMHFAETGQRALVEALTWQPDVILCDVMMSEMDGFEFCRRVRADIRLDQVPIILITALDDRRSKLTGLEAGADDFITKPVDSFELRARLRTITRLDRYRKLNNERLKLEQAHHELLQAYDATIEGWSRALDLRDKETEGHTQRVTAMTVQLARSCGIEEDELRHIRWGALLHDIGKMGVPDEILFKPSKLTDEEWIIMRRHPIHAYEMLAPIEFLQKAIDIPYCHHEKWDGTGYPRGLQGTAIPLAARLFAVVDIWDALTSDRPYRPAMPPEYVLGYIRSLSGTHLSPAVVELFLNQQHK